MKHLASPRFWRHYRLLPEVIQKLADKNFELLKADPHHPPLHFKKVGELWSVRVGAHYRALGMDEPGAIVCIKLLEQDGWYLARTKGSHRQFKQLVKSGTVTVAGKKSLDVPRGTLNSILKQAGLMHQED